MWVLANSKQDFYDFWEAANEFDLDLGFLGSWEARFLGSWKRTTKEKAN
jgi:hypothetical protein